MRTKTSAFFLAYAFFFLFIPTASFSIDGSGSGFFVSNQGHIATNFHVIKDARSVEVIIDKERLPAKEVCVDPVNDLAIIKIEKETTPCVFKDSGDVTLGEEVTTIGFPNPDVQGLSPKLTTGVISSVTGLQDDPRHFQISAPIQPGNSGGPLFDKNGQVIGIVVSTISPFFMARYKNSIPQNVNYAVKYAYLAPLLANAKIQRKAVQEKAQRSIQKQDLAELVCCVLVTGVPAPPSQGADAPPDSSQPPINPPARKPSIENIKIVEHRLYRDNGNGGVGPQVQSFRASDRNKHFSVMVNTPLPTGTNAKWIFTAVDTRHGQNMAISEVEYRVNDEVDTLSSNLELPRDWPPGKYKAELFINGTFWYRIDYQVTRR